MNRWKITLLLPLALLLGGCVTYPTYPTHAYRDDVRDTRYVGGSSYYSPAYGDYGDYYSGGYRYGSSGYGYYAPDYITYSAYYSLFWPVNHWYHDPYWYPGFYYGVTYFPRNYFSVSFHSGWRGHGSPRWGYGGAYSIAFGYSHWYSPYRYSWADSYYDWDRYRYQYRDNRRGHGHYAPSLNQPRFGHARNQAERLAWQDRERSTPRGDGIATGMGLRAPAVYGNARVPSRGADYGNRGGAGWSAPAQQGTAPLTRQASMRPAWSSDSSAYRASEASGRGSAQENGRRGLMGRGADSESLPQRGPRTEVIRRNDDARNYREAPAYRERAYTSERSPASMREYGNAPARESMRVREYNSEPRLQRPESPRAYAPEQRFTPSAPREGIRTERSGRSAEFGARSYSTPEPAPRAERPREESFRSAPTESRREMSAPRSAPSNTGHGGGRSESRARGALRFE